MNASLDEVEKTIKQIAQKYASGLNTKVKERIDEMEGDDNAHYLIYKVFGISFQEGKMIDAYQNKGRFLYKYAGSFLEQVVKYCFKVKFPDSGSLRIVNSLGSRPKMFEIDCLVNQQDAIEIKWRDATTDGDHITKEHTRIHNIASAGYKPIRIMFFYPNRKQAIRIQKTLETLYKGVEGEYYWGEDAWGYVYKRTDIDLKSILHKIAEENESNA